MRNGAERSIAAATRLVRLAFGELGVPFAVRLWDGTLVAPVDAAPRVTLAFRSRRTFRRLFARPTPLRFGEAFIASEIDLEGDLFEALRATHRLEDARWPLGRRLAMWRAWLRV